MAEDNGGVTVQIADRVDLAGAASLLGTSPIRTAREAVPDGSSAHSGLDYSRSFPYRSH
jgi:hypothetical protein